MKQSFPQSNEWCTAKSPYWIPYQNKKFIYRERNALKKVYAMKN